MKVLSFPISVATAACRAADNPSTAIGLLFGVRKSGLPTFEHTQMGICCLIVVSIFAERLRSKPIYLGAASRHFATNFRDRSD